MFDLKKKKIYTFFIINEETRKSNQIKKKLLYSVAFIYYRKRFE